MQCNSMDKNLDQSSAEECTTADPGLTKSPEEEKKSLYVFVLYRCFYQHWARDSVSPVCGIFIGRLPLFIYMYIN